MGGSPLCIYLSQMPVLHSVLLTLGAIVEIDNKIEGIYYPLISYRCWDINYQARCFSCREKVRDWLYFYCFLKEIGETVFNQIFLPLRFIAVCFIFEKIIKLCMIIWKDPQLWGVAMVFFYLNRETHSCIGPKYQRFQSVELYFFLVENKIAYW